MDIEVIYQIPAFVKEASDEQFDTTRSDAVVVEGLRIDNKPAAWRAAATLRKKAMSGETVSSHTEMMVKRACDLYDISDADFVLNDVPGDHVIVKTASEGVEFVICDNDQFNTAVSSVISERSKHPVDFIRKCASELLSVQTRNGYTLSNKQRDFLCKVAGTAYIDADACKAEIKKRVTYAYNNGMDKEAEVLRKLASLCNTMTDRNMLLTNAVIDAVDLFDQETGLVHKLAHNDMNHIEQVTYLNDAESLVKQANELIDLGHGTSIRKASIMNYENMERMSKWAFDIGRDLPTYSDCNDIVSFVKELSPSLKKEFVETFGI